MYKKYLTLSAIAASASAADTSDHWAVIVAGSNQFYNYRHQSDTCHAFQIMKANGIPEDQIIHLSYNDVAKSSENPFPDTLFNKPTEAGTPGVDVNKGCQVDYEGKDVTAENILAVLKGDEATAGGKVLKSTENSKVFFYFADHGAPGLLGTPVGKYLYADQLHDAVKYMHTNNMYKEMTMYIEACESGSIFENILEDDIGVYAVSATDSTTSSWGTYCSPDDKVNGKSIGSCLGDLFSVNWMEDTDAADIKTETLQEQYANVKKTTTKSPVLQWGQTNFTSEPIADFQSNTDAEQTPDFWTQMIHDGLEFIDDALMINEAEIERKNTFAVDSRDVKLHYFYNKVMKDSTPENHAALQAELSHRMKIDNIFETAFGQEHMDIVRAGETAKVQNFECYRTLIDHFENQCEKFDDYSLKYAKALVQECETNTYLLGIDASLEKINNACPQ